MNLGKRKSLGKPPGIRRFSQQAVQWFGDDLRGGEDGNPVSEQVLAFVKQ
jgi:hypothetical protein